MSDSESTVIGSVILAVMGIVFQLLQEDKPLALRSLFSYPWSRLQDFNLWIAGRLATLGFSTSARRVLQAELLTLGFTLMQIGEWAAAITCWVLLGFLGFSKALGWGGIKEEDSTKPMPIPRIFGAIGTLGMCVFLIAVTDLRKPNEEPWSNLQKLWEVAITVNPAKVSFRGYPNETFNFSVRNGRSDDVYDVQIPFLIGQDKHFDDKLSAKVSHGDDPQPIYDDYNYCFGKKGNGDVKNVLPHEQEVLIVRVGHLAPSASTSFTMTYAGGEQFEANSRTATFLSEPYSYSGSQFTVGVRGDYRICKYVISTKGGSQK